MRLMPLQLPALMLRREQTGIAGCKRLHIVHTFTTQVKNRKEKTMQLQLSSQTWPLLPSILPAIPTLMTV